MSAGATAGVAKHDMLAALAQVAEVCDGRRFGPEEIAAVVQLSSSSDAVRLCFDTIAGEDGKITLDDLLQWAMPDYPRDCRKKNVCAHASPSKAACPGQGGQAKGAEELRLEVARLSEEACALRAELSRLKGGLLAGGQDCDVDDYGDHWSPEIWARSLELHLVVGAALRAPDGADSFAFCQGLAKDPDKVEELLRSAQLGGVSGMVIEGLRELATQEYATGRELNDKVISKTAQHTMLFGPANVANRRLASWIGPPKMVDGSVRKSMEGEHCSMEDSDETFKTFHGMSTTSRVEWEFVVDPCLDKEYPQREKLKDTPDRWRKPRPLQDFLEIARPISQQLLDHGEPELIEVEIIAGRLYTGDMGAKYNAVLQARSEDSFFIRKCNDLCRGNTYSTTIYVLSACVSKLCAIAKPAEYWIGYPPDLQLPDTFWISDWCGRRGGVAYGMTSVFFQKEQISSRANWLVKVPKDTRSRGADMAWLSPYPHEKKAVFPPLTSFQVLKTTVSRGTLHAEVALMASTNLGTLEEFIGKRRIFVEELVEGTAVEVGLVVKNLQARSEAQSKFRTEAQEILKDDVDWYNNNENYATTLSKVADIKRRTVDEFSVVHFQVAEDCSPEDVAAALVATKLPRRTRLVRDVVEEFVVKEQRERLVREERELSRFEGAELIPGSPELAALGITKQLGVDDQVIWSGMGAGLAAMAHEVNLSGTDDDKVCFKYIVEGEIGASTRKWEHSGGKVMDHFYQEVNGGEQDVTTSHHDGRHGRKLEYFVDHPQSKAAGLLKEHVVALRFYTTAAYKTINDPLRNMAKDKPPHPLPVTVAYLSDGIKRLRAVHAQRERAVSETDGKRDFWRGMRNLKLPHGFMEDGGTELATMSTSSKLQVALAYSNNAEERLLFKVVTDGFMDRGADLKYLSAFPGEVEFLYPPMTYLKPTGRKEKIEFHNVSFTVVEVAPKL